MLVMSSTTSAIHASSAAHTALLNGIAELDYAQPALSQCSKYVADLRTQKTRSDQELSGMKKSTEKERNDHLEIKKSIARKWSNRLVGRGQKFKERVTKEEREYLEALEHEQDARSTHERLLADLAEAEKNERDLQAAVERRNGLQRELDALYDRIFSGSTPEFPQEDVLEDRVSAAQAHNYEAQAALTFESQTLAVLSQARRALDACAKQMLSAKDCSTWDVWGGGVGADLMEREGLFNAANAAAQFENLFSQARRMNGAVRAIPLPQIPKPSTMDLVFDNIFTDLEMHDKIKRGVATVEGSVSALNSVYNEAQQRVEGASMQAGYTADALARARRELHELREETMNQVLRQSGSPPAAARSEQGIAFPSPQHQDGPPPPFAPSPVGSFSPPPGAPPGHPDATVSANKDLPSPPPDHPPSDSTMLAATSPGSTTRPLRLSSKNPYAALLARGTK